VFLTLTKVKRDDLRGKRVLVRVDFNVPIKGSVVQDSTRIKAALPTIKFLKKQGAKIILASHLGRPKGTVQKKFSLRPVAKELQRILKTKVTFTPHCIGPIVKKAIAKLGEGDVLLLENLRFHKQEKTGAITFGKKLASLADIFVNDAFSNSHRAHASMIIPPKNLPSYAGFLVQKEIENLTPLLKPKKPFVVLMGGAKVHDKLPLIRSLAKRADKLLIGSAGMFTFLKAQGIEVGHTLVDDKALRACRSLLKKYPKKLLIGHDCRTLEGKVVRTRKSTEIPSSANAMDTGPSTMATFAKHIAKAKTIFWNGPLGVFEDPRFAKGTMTAARILAKSSGTTIIGGGDSGAAVSKARVKSKITFVSTAGGAALEFVAAKKLPGIEALKVRGQIRILK
jgi:phosphoglycerate kinase